MWGEQKTNQAFIERVIRYLMCWPLLFGWPSGMPGKAKKRLSSGWTGFTPNGAPLTPGAHDSVPGAHIGGDWAVMHRCEMGVKTQHKASLTAL